MSRTLSVEVTCPGVPFLNANHRVHRHVRARAVAAWRTAGMAAWLLAGHQHQQWVSAHCHAELWYPDRRRHDPLNNADTVKAIVDGIQDAGGKRPFLPDDDWKHLIPPDLRYGGVRAGAPTVYLTFTDTYIDPTVHSWRR